MSSVTANGERNVLETKLIECPNPVILAWILHKKLRISTVKQLAFILQTEWVDVQSRLLFWVSYTLQSLLEHFGTSWNYVVVYIS